jgi:hypothetical protein
MIGMVDTIRAHNIFSGWEITGISRTVLTGHLVELWYNLVEPTQNISLYMAIILVKYNIVH